ncbi:Hypp8940 [Branchiostoma lanceolatum]|uniref:Hypp8940 protein n=1 Tax=Branchiostoma lanceolatum TaxID=7740 RepID=A0A8J9ZC06_BRALA|nr:Hypp8940 [Branchiostoma lanceolatum]
MYTCGLLILVFTGDVVFSSSELEAFGTENGTEVPRNGSAGFSWLELTVMSATSVRITWPGMPDLQSYHRVLYGKPGAEEQLHVLLKPGDNAYIISHLIPSSSYRVCILKSDQTEPHPAQCRVFTTAEDTLAVEYKAKGAILGGVVIMLIFVGIIYRCVLRRYRTSQGTPDDAGATPLTDLGGLVEVHGDGGKKLGDILSDSREITEDDFRVTRVR